MRRRAEPGGSELLVATSHGPISSPSFEVPSGTHRITVDSERQQRESQLLLCGCRCCSRAPEPPPPSGAPIPGIIQAEDYNEGGQNVGYYDTTAGNSTGKYRNDDVDIQKCSDPDDTAGESCFYVGTVLAGEWLAFDVYTPVDQHLHAHLPRCGECRRTARTR